MAHVGALPPIHRFITTHDTSGKAIFSTTVSENCSMDPLPNNNEAAFALGYTTKGFPVNLNDNADITSYSQHLTSAPGLVVSNGTVLRYVDTAPGAESAMHRTVSLDYGIVLEGEVELILDSGEKRVLKRGDVAIQRGTSHAWRNTSKTEWARMVYVLQSCQPITMGGEKLGEDLADMKGVRSSD